MPVLGQGFTEPDPNLTDSFDDVMDLNMMTLIMTEENCKHSFILSVQAVW